jgi:hypothetical protein
VRLPVPDGPRAMMFSPAIHIITTC